MATPDIKLMRLNPRRVDAWNKLLAQLDEHERIFQDKSSSVIRDFMAYFTTEAQKRLERGELLFDFADAVLAEAQKVAPLKGRLALSTLRAIELYWLYGEAFKKWRKAQG